MLKVVLFLVLFNSQTGEVISTFQTATAENKTLAGPPGFRSVDECEAARDIFIEQNPAPEGLSQKGFCVEPLKSKATKL